MKDTKETAKKEKPRFHDAHVGDDVYCRLNGYGYIHNFSDKDHNVFKVYFPETEIYEEYYSHGVLELHHKEPTLFYRKGEEKYLTERPEPEYEVDWSKVPMGTKVFTYLRKEDMNDPYWNKDEDIEIFMGYFSKLDDPFWIFDADDKETASGYKYCKLAEPCKSEWKK